MRRLALLIWLALGADVAHNSAFAQRPRLVMPADEDRLEYGGYVAEKFHDGVLQSWTVRLTNAGHLVGVFSLKQSVAESHHISLGLHSFLGGSEKQLVVRMWTGGTKCCDVYWIAELVPHFRLIFNGRDYNDLRDSGEGYLQAADIDGDGQIEFWQDTTTFDYFKSSFADSPSVTIYFKYDREKKLYRPANVSLWPVIMRQIAALEEAIQQARSQDDPSKYETEEESEILHRSNYRRSVLTATLAHIYAGKEKEGWAFFEEQYRLADKAEWRSAIKRELRREYQFYKRLNP